MHDLKNYNDTYTFKKSYFRDPKINYTIYKLVLSYVTSIGILSKSGFRYSNNFGHSNKKCTMSSRCYWHKGQSPKFIT